LDDGVSGLLAIKKAGGILMIQDPEEAEYPDLPLNAARKVDIDFILPLSTLAGQIVRTVNEEMGIDKKPSGNNEMEFETKISEFDLSAVSDEKDHIGEPSVFACPSCKGVLWEIKEGDLVRYRCRVGHGFSADSLAVEQSEVIEQALWTALTTLEERASFLRKMATESRSNEQVAIFRIYEKRIEDIEEKAHSIRKILKDSDHYSGLKPTEKELD
jgi:two-component system chemotaxis response regulator CheB